MVKLRGGEEYPFYFGAKPELLRIARDFRRNITIAEKILWQHLRNRKLTDSFSGGSIRFMRLLLISIDTKHE